MCLLGTAQFLNPWNQTGHHHPYFLVTLFLKGSSCFLSPKPSKTWFTKDTSFKKNVVCSTVETELSWANSLSNVWQMSCITVFPLKIKRSCSTSVSLLQSYRVPSCTVWKPNVFTKFLLFTPLHSAPQFIQSYNQSCSVSDQIKAPKRTAKPDDVFTLRTILTGHFETTNNNQVTKPEVLKLNLVIQRRLTVRCTSWGSLWLWRINQKGRQCHQLDQPDGYRNCGAGKG